MDSTLVIYTGLPLPYISVNPGDDLQTALISIDTAVNAMNPAPDYTPYALQCLRPTYTITDTQEFAEAVADFICTTRADLDTFVSTTYVTDQAVLAAAINGLQDPALIFAPFGVVNTDNIQQVWAKVWTGLSTMIATGDPSTANWASVGVMVAPTTVADAFDEIIILALNAQAALAGMQTDLGTFDNSANCLAGGATDDALTTINLLRSYICTLPAFDPGNITFGCVAPGVDLETSIDNIIATLGGVMASYVETPGTGLTLDPVISCVGRTINIDTSWEGLYKVAMSQNDASLGNADYLGAKVTSLDGSLTIDILTNPDKLDLSVTTPVDLRTKVNVSDPSPGFLAEKIPSSGGDWGLAINTQANFDDTKLLLIPTVNNADVLINNIITAIQTDPDLLARFCATVAMCAGCLCDVITDLIVVLDGLTFELNWTPTGGSTTSQVAKYRQAGTISWLTGNFTPANILSAVASTTVASGLAANTLYDFQVDSNCPGDVSNSNINQMIRFEEQAVVITPVAGVVSVTQNPMPTVDVIDYRLLDQNLVVVQNVSATGIAPSASFTAVPNGNYNLEFRQGTLVNGVMLYSDDATQSAAWYLDGPFAV